jgi:uncharacterized protein (TIGR03086 family)
MYSLVTDAVSPTIAIVGGIHADQLADPTPCAEFDVQALLDHLYQYGPALEAAAGVVAQPAPDLPSQLSRIAEAWCRPEAWVGETSMGGAPIPAAMFGGMVVTEVVVHGWDLARATGQPATWSDDVLTYVHDELVKTAELGREMGLYAPAVPVPDDAGLLERTVALTGRSPSWNGAFRSASMGT